VSRRVSLCENFVQTSFVSLSFRCFRVSIYLGDYRKKRISVGGDRREAGKCLVCFTYTWSMDYFTPKWQVNLPVLYVLQRRTPKQTGHNRDEKQNKKKTTPRLGEGSFRKLAGHLKVKWVKLLFNVKFKGSIWVKFTFSAKSKGRADFDALQRLYFTLRAHDSPPASRSILLARPGHRLGP
jgi:hypothetical protein